MTATMSRAWRWRGSRRAVAADPRAVATSTMIVLIYGGYLVRGAQMSIGDLMAFMLYVTQLALQTTSLGWVLSIYQRGQAAMKRIDDIFSTAARPRSMAARSAWRSKARSNGRTSRSAISHTMEPAGANMAATAITRCAISMSKVTAGEKLAIVGRTGSGKSTMIKLLARLIEPTAGRVLLDGRDIRDIPVRALRRTIGVVPQEPTLFSDTLARNIAFGAPNA